MRIELTHPALSPLIGPEFDEFLGASIGDDRIGAVPSVLSALARLDVDPWKEAESLARMPRESAVARLSALIDALPNGATSAIPSTTRAAELVALLPRGRVSNTAPTDSVSAAGGLPQTRILVAFCTFAAMMLIVVSISALLSPEPRDGAHPPPPLATEAPTESPHKPAP